MFELWQTTVHNDNDNDGEDGNNKNNDGDDNHAASAGVSCHYP